MFEGMVVLGENLNATRKVKADGKMVVEYAPGRKGYPYTSMTGERKYLDLTDALQSEAVQKSGKVGYIAAGVVQRDEEFIAAIAHRQIQDGADALDLCVDEITPWSEQRIAHMRWLVQTVQKHVPVPLMIDSSDPATIRAGLEEVDWSIGRPIINSINLEEARLPMLPIAQETNARLLANASGASGLPTDVDGRVANISRIMQLMDDHAIALGDRYLDPLVLPIGTNPEHGRHFLESCAQLRERFGKEFHMTGGFSNVSFGLPNRRLLNEAMTWLAREAGCDTAFIDPAQVRGFAPGDEGFQKAVAALRGEDMYCIEYITWARTAGVA